VETIQDSTVLTWTRASIRDLAARFPQLLENVISMSEDYLHWYVSAYETLTCQSAEQRLAGLLIGLTEQIGQPTSGGIRLDVRNEELANAANITVFTVSRILKTWQHCRALSKTRNSLVLHSKCLLLATLGSDNFHSS
jgi:CRP-like cAMP-binding protein